MFVHGWAMNSAVWQVCAEYFPDWLDAIFVDLPGHGSMRDVSAGDLEDYVNTVAAVVSRPVIWVGWSMGGLVTLKLAEMYPQKVSALYQVASTPCFVQREGWPDAVEQKVFLQFAELLVNDIEQTLKRFIALQLLGVESARGLMQQLHRSMLSRGMASEQALQQGLEILMQSDLREILPGIERPIGWYLGARDALVPVALADDLRKLAPDIEIAVEPGASHAPMVSHPQQFVQHLVSFIARLNSGNAYG